jgi:hypothetical protein
MTHEFTLYNVQTSMHVPLYETEATVLFLNLAVYSMLLLTQLFHHEMKQLSFVGLANSAGLGIKTLVSAVCSSSISKIRVNDTDISVNTVETSATC